ncbi:MAG: Asp-tRNA(Asn)/Glu-tRNA(Gln) amidotransferase subunit GatC [Candidatus Sericytochromatia bacterium]|nr:Asp-tRNA(Asn)/Glu-tRNA(Gln) amidotransferase subunit GatC [Candidatus Sericytochromatia bacterium]
MITSADVRHVAKLAKLSLSETEVATYTQQLSQLLGHFEALQSLDVTGVAPTPRAIPLHNVWRPDTASGDLPHDAALANAPATEGPYFKVPKII